jgi:broad specificity phosphatase PhoE
MTFVRALMRVKEFLATAFVQPNQQVSTVVAVSQGDLIRFEGFQILFSLWHGRWRMMMISAHCDL